MQSKSFVINQISSDKPKHNKSNDFMKFYKPAGETNVILLEKNKTENYHEPINEPHNMIDTFMKRNHKKKNKTQHESIDISTINIDGSNLLQSSGKNSPVKDFKLTSTPKDIRKSSKRVKSIMKSPTTDESLSITTANTSSGRSKKRNKSVSFMLDANEEVVVKKSKSNESLTKIPNTNDNNNAEKSEKKKNKVKHRNKDEKENEAHAKFITVDADTSDGKHKLKKNAANVDNVTPMECRDAPLTEKEGNIEKKKKRKFKKGKSFDSADVEPKESEPVDGDVTTEQTVNKTKKKKRHAKTSPDLSDKDVESEPATKTRKKNVKPDLETGLENLNIGDNAHTLTDLLDKMTVVDKKKKKTKKKKELSQKKHNTTPSGNDLTEEDKPADEKEKVKWSKRRWNKDKKHILKETRLVTSVVVENLPLKIMSDYKKLLAEHFAKCGLVQQVGVVELYPSEDPKPVFTTTVFFESEDAAAQALEEDNTMFMGGRMRVRRPLAPAQTTVVVRAHTSLEDHALSSAFAGAGRLRSIRHAAKGKKSMSTAFVEFDGPEAVERALKLAEDARIGGKKMYASRYEPRHAHKQTETSHKAQSVNN